MGTTPEQPADTIDLHGRSFVREADHDAAELNHLVSLAAELKAARRAGAEVGRLEGRQVVLVFEKTSTRTRCAFEVAAREQGAGVTTLDGAGSQLGHKESVADTARVLGRMFDGIMFRGEHQRDVEELARHAGVPVWNGLTDDWHPTQMLADVLTMCEHSAKAPGELSFAFLGDCRFNMGRSLLVTGAILGADVRLCGPRELWPPAEVRALADELAAASGANVLLTDDVGAAVQGVDAVHTDIWVSMGEPAEVWRERVELLEAFRVTADVMDATGNPEARFLHCLPAYHDTATDVGREVAALSGRTDGIEVSDEVFESPASVVFDQAENRLHTAKAVMVATLAGT